MVLSNLRVVKFFRGLEKINTNQKIQVLNMLEAPLLPHKKGLTNFTADIAKKNNQTQPRT